MKFNIRGEKLEVTPSIREYIEKKVGKVDKYLGHTEEVFVHANIKTYQDGKAKVEVMITDESFVLRAEEVDQTLYGAIDLVSDKLERQIRKNKAKVNRKMREKGKKEIFTLADDLPEEEDFDFNLEIVRSKEIDLKPMDVEEAILQMDMLGHNFFVYNDAKTNETAIVYKRKHGKYGLLQLN